MIIQEDLLIIKGELRKLNHRLIKDDLRRNSLLLTTAERKSSEDPETIITNSQHDRSLDDVSPPVLSVDHLDPMYVSHDSDIARGQFSPNAPELSPNDLILNRLMFDEGGPPSAPSFSQVCMSQPQEKTATNVSSSRKLISRKISLRLINLVRSLKKKMIR